MSRVPPYILGLKHEAPVLHCLRFAQEKTTLVRDFRSSGLAAASESEVPYSSRFLGPSAVHLCVYDCLKGHLRREQVLVYSWAGDVSAARDQSDGARDVSVPGLGAQRRTVEAERVRKHGT